MRPRGAHKRPRLPKIAVAPIPDRLGQVLHNHLLDRLSPGGAPSKPKYRANVSLSVSKEGLAIARDESATRYNVTLTAEYSLLLMATGESVLNGQARSIATYDVVTSDYATLVAERDAKLRAARKISDELKTRIAVFLAQKSQSR